jgi:hypothetical protein
MLGEWATRLTAHPAGENMSRTRETWHSKYMYRFSGGDVRQNHTTAVKWQGFSYKVAGAALHRMTLNDASTEHRRQRQLMARVFHLPARESARPARRPVDLRDDPSSRRIVRGPSLFWPAALQLGEVQVLTNRLPVRLSISLKVRRTDLGPSHAQICKLRGRDRFGRVWCNGGLEVEPISVLP